MANMKAFFNVACSGVLVCFELKKLKYLQYKVLTRDCTERLVIKWSECFCNSASQIWIVNFFSLYRWLLTAIVIETTFTSISAVILPKQFYFTPNLTQSKYLKSVGVASKLIGEHQGDKEAKMKTGVQCLMTFSVSGVS